MSNLKWDMSNDIRPCSARELVIRENFKKDYKLSCPLLDDNDSFAKSLEIWELTQEWVDYLSMSKKYPDFDAYRKSIRNDIVKTIESVPGFSNLTEIQNPFPNYTGPRSYLEENNCGLRLVSIDLIKGNYQGLKCIGSQYVLKTETYEELVGKFTNEQALIRSKYFRQLVFGLLKPDVQVSCQKKILAHMITEILKIKQFKIVHLTSDEVVFHITSDQEMIKIQEALRPLPYQYRVEEFTIDRIPNGYHEPWYVRYNRSSNNRRLMSIHVKFLFQVYNFVSSKENQEKDFWWRERGRLCSLMEPELFAPIGQPDP